MSTRGLRRLGREEREEALEAGLTRSELIEREGRKILRIRWVTGKTSAGRLFGKYGKDGRPDFFRLLFGAIAGSLREQFGDEGEKLFNELREKPEYRSSLRQVFDDMKNWFFNEIVPKCKIEPGDIFVIITELELDLETGRLTWYKDRSEVIYWIRSDKVQEMLEELRKTAGAPPEVEELRKRVQELEKENTELRKRVEELMRENADLKSKLADYIARSTEAEDLRAKVEDLTRQLEQVRSERDSLRKQVEELTQENERLRTELSELKATVEKLKKFIETVKV